MQKNHKRAALLFSHQREALKEIVMTGSTAQTQNPRRAPGRESVTLSTSSILTHRAQKSEKEAAAERSRKV